MLSALFGSPNSDAQSERIHDGLRRDGSVQRPSWAIANETRDAKAETYNGTSMLKSAARFVLPYKGINI